MLYSERTNCPEAHMPANTPTRDASLTRLYRRLERDTLEHLRTHCAELAERIEALETENADLKRQLSWAEQSCDMWRDIVQLRDERDNEHTHIGLMVDGTVVLLQNQAPENAAEVPA